MVFVSGCEMVVRRPLPLEMRESRDCAYVRVTNGFCDALPAAAAAAGRY